MINSDVDEIVFVHTTLLLLGICTVYECYHLHFLNVIENKHLVCMVSFFLLKFKHYMSIVLLCSTGPVFSSCGY